MDHTESYRSSSQTLNLVNGRLRGIHALQVMKLDHLHLSSVHHVCMHLAFEEQNSVLAKTEKR